MFPLPLFFLGVCGSAGARRGLNQPTLESHRHVWKARREGGACGRGSHVLPVRGLWPGVVSGLGARGSLWSGPSIVQEAEGRTLVELCQPPDGPPSPHPCPLPGSADLLALTLPLCSAPAPPHPRLGSAHPAQVPGLPCLSGTSLLSPCSLPCWPSVGRAWVTSSRGPPLEFLAEPMSPWALEES